MDDGQMNILPSELRGLVGNHRVALRWENIAKTFYVQGNDGVNTYLKIQQTGLAESLERQANRLLWAKNKLPVPEVIDYGEAGGYEYLLTSELPGVEASSPFFKNNTGEMITLLAQGLRNIHEVSTVDCPYDNSMDKLLNVIRCNYEQGVVLASDETKKFGTDKIQNLIQEVEAYARSLEEDPVFTHGDYSLPNIMIHQGRISGFIDLGNCGIADRYYDLAVAEKSIIRNVGVEYVELFYQAYGLPDVDRQKIRFYQIVEFLVWG